MSLRHRFLFFRDEPEASWERYGRENPYYGVLTSEQYLSHAMDREKLSDFFASGEEYVRNILTWVNEKFAGRPRHSKALDFGCGVGRLVIPLAQRFEQVVGVDISYSMLVVAAKNCSERGIQNTDFVLTQEMCRDRLGRFAFIHSYIVLQHIPKAEGERLMRRLVDMLEPGGIAVLHVTIGRRSLLRRVTQQVQRNFVPVAWLINVVRGRPWNTPVMQMNSYSLNRIAILLRETGIEEFFVRVEERQGTIGAFVLLERSDI